MRRLAGIGIAAVKVQQEPGIIIYRVVIPPDIGPGPVRVGYAA
jgi:hypothetical protein